MEVLTGVFILAILYAFYTIISKLISKKEQKPEISFSVKLTDEYENDEYDYENDDYGYEEPKGKPAKWLSFGESITVQGHDIPGGLIYVGEKLLDQKGYRNDACLIQPKSKIVEAEPWEGSEDMGYWPRYADIPAQCRGAYLKWLATGRSEPEAYIGYIFLFFYGLERRVFNDAIDDGVSESEREIIVSEVKRLLRIYGDNKSFNGYANNFIVMERIIFGQGFDVTDSIGLLNHQSILPFQILLANFVNEGKPITHSVALQWLRLSPDYRLRTPARRCENEFEILFGKFFVEKYPDGLVVKPNKKKIDVYFRAANDSLGYNEKLNKKLKNKVGKLPNPFPLKGPLNKINTIAEKCTNALESYSRYLGRKDNNPKSMAAFSLLPKTLLIERPGFKDARNKLSKACERGPILIDVEKFYAGFKEPLPLKMGKKESETLANLIEGLGFGMSPDVRYHNSKPVAEGKIVLFEKGHGVDFSPSREYRTMTTILRLGAMVSQVDDDVSHNEEALLSQLIIEDRELNSIEKESLQAFLKWSLYTPQGITGVKQRLSVLNKEEKTAISHILISVAHADGRIDPTEIKQLEKLYTQLGLDKARVTNDLHELAATSVAHEPVTVAKKDKRNNHYIPKPDREPVQGFSLNEELIRIREAETKQVKGILENVFVNEVDDEEVSPEIEPEITSKAIDLLDKPHQDLLNQLLQKEDWSRDALYEICKKLELMIDGAMEVINEWAYEQVNAPLIEDGDPLFVDIELAKEIING
ncbi:MAG: TerB N-terminal domain-containing protein [Woeseiaceae bacterium]